MVGWFHILCLSALMLLAILLAANSTHPTPFQFVQLLSVLSVLASLLWASYRTHVLPRAILKRTLALTRNRS